MIVLQGKIPPQVYVACSGGPDSMAVTAFLAKKHDVTVCYFNHGSVHGNSANTWVKDASDQLGLKFISSTVSRDKFKQESQEEYWRNMRYEWFHSLQGTVVTGHHLDDCVETWIWSSLHGQGKLIPYSNQNVIRPFRLNQKLEFTSWCSRNSIKYLTDPSNSDNKYMRNLIRNQMMPHVLAVNPGIHTVIRKKIVDHGIYS